MKVNHRSLFIAVSILMAAITGVGAAIYLSTDDKPSESDIAKALASELPAYWSVAAVKISHSQREGDEAARIYRQRFAATLKPRLNLYVVDESRRQLGPFTVVTLMAATTREFGLHGTATSTLRLGRWAPAFSLENSVSGLGRPRALFDRPVVVAGSERAARVENELLWARDTAKSLKPRAKK